MSEYRVVWEIDVDAESYEEAAKEAFNIQRDPDSTATVFTVIDSEAYQGGEPEAKKEIDIQDMIEDQIYPNRGNRRKFYPEN